VERVNVPTYAELLARTDGAPPGSAWGVFGDDDSLGSLNFLSAAGVLNAVRSVRTGQVFPLEIPVDEFPLGTGGRRPPKHAVYNVKPLVVEDYLDGLYLQGSTQWDALRHTEHPEHGFYNGFTAEECDAGRLGMHHVAKKGIVGRGLLIDLERHAQRHGRTLDHEGREMIPVATVEACMEEQGVETEPGDILLLHTGWLGWYRTLDADAQYALMSNASIPSAGPSPGEEMAHWVWDHQLAAVAADNVAVEATGRGSQLHFVGMPLLGVMLGEFFDLGALAADCAAASTYDCLFVSAPLHVHGGAGSTGNAVAIR
jgi:kynurenine formamidase